MVLQNDYWSSNLKLLRNRKEMSQGELALALEMSRSKIAHHESEKHTNPPLGDLMKFSEYFQINIDSLLKVDLSKLGELKLKELESADEVYMSGGKIRVLSITVTPSNKENVEFVPIKAKAGYLAGYNDPEFIGKLPKFSLPHLADKRTYRIFPTEGDSMLPIPENCFVISEYVADWNTLNDTPCIVIMRTEQRFLFKMVTRKNEQISLHSLNPMYKDQQVFAGDVLEIWKYHSHITDIIPSEKAGLQEILRTVQEIRADVKHLKSGQKG
jgi:transcriptional regulator with XRE-family HTH domain